MHSVHSGVHSGGHMVGRRSLGVLAIALSCASAVKVCTSAVTITKAESKWGKQPVTEPWTNAKVYAIITFEHSRAWVMKEAGRCNGEKSGDAQIKVDKSTGTKTMEFCCDSDEVVKPGKDFDTAIFKVMHAGFGFHTTLGTVEVRLDTHKKGPSPEVTAGGGSFAIYDVDKTCAEEWDIRYFDTDEKRKDKAFFGERVFCPRGWYYYTGGDEAKRLSTIPAPIPVAPKQSAASAAEEEAFAMVKAHDEEDGTAESTETDEEDADGGDEGERRLASYGQYNYGSSAYSYECGDAKVRKDYGFVTVAFPGAASAAARAAPTGAQSMSALPVAIVLVVGAAGFIRKTAARRAAIRLL